MDSIIKSFTEAITKIAKLTIGKNKNKPKQPKVPWWDNDIKNTIKSKNKALNIFKKTKIVIDYINLKRHGAFTKFIIKKKSQETFTNNINEETDIKLIWNKIRSLKELKRNYKINLINENNNNLITNPN